MITSQIKARIRLIRGLPGSGKSTMAKLMDGFVHFEADMYFEVGGEFVYDPANVSKVHISEHRDRSFR
jgi:ABC-type proline/glycine betaine transport system ATPase subunit